MGKIDGKEAAGIRCAAATSGFRLSPDVLGTWLYHLVRLVIGGIFIYAGAVKLLAPRAFAHVIAQYGLVPDPLLPVVAVGLPAIELLAGMGLVFGIRGSLTGITILLGMFLLVLGYAIFMDMNIDCGCFTQEEIDGQHGLKTAFLRDMLMIAAILFLYWRRRMRSPAKPVRKKLLSTKGEGN